LKDWKSMTRAVILAALMLLTPLSARAGGPSGISDAPGDNLMRVFANGLEINRGDTITPGSVLTVLITATNRLNRNVGHLEFSLDAGPQKWGTGLVGTAMADDGSNIAVAGNYTTWGFNYTSPIALIPVLDSIVIRDSTGAILTSSHGTAADFFTQQGISGYEQGLGYWSLAPGETITATSQLQVTAAAPEPSSFAFLFLSALPGTALVLKRK
jgi:hypothetical protein